MGWDQACLLETRLSWCCNTLFQGATIFYLDYVNLLTSLVTLLILASLESVLQTGHSLKFSIGRTVFLENNPNSFPWHIGLWDLTLASLSKFTSCHTPWLYPLLTMLQTPSSHVSVFKTPGSSLPHSFYICVFPARSFRPHVRAC